MPAKAQVGKLKLPKPKNFRSRPLQQTQLVVAPASEIPVTLDRSFELVRTVITAAVSDTIGNPLMQKLIFVLRSAISLGSGEFLLSSLQLASYSIVEMCSLMNATRY